MQRLWSCALILIFRLTPALTDPIIDRRCEESWKYYGCFCYRFFSAEVNWDQAKRECRDYKGELVSIHSQEENDFINDLMPSQAECWIGLHDTVDEKTWEWIDKSEANFINWAKKQPNSKDREQDCVEFWSIESTWNDESCVVKNPFICKKIAEAEDAVDNIEVIPGATEATIILNTGGECLSYLRATDQETNRTWDQQRAKGESTHGFTISPLQPCTDYTMSVVAEYKVDASRKTPPFNVSFSTSIHSFPPAPSFNITKTKGDKIHITWGKTDPNCLSSYILSYMQVHSSEDPCHPKEVCSSFEQKTSSILASDIALLSVDLNKCSTYAINLGYMTRFNDVIFPGRLKLFKTACDANPPELTLSKSGEGVKVEWSPRINPEIYQYELSYQPFDHKKTVRFQKGAPTQYEVEQLQQCTKYAFELEYVKKSGEIESSQESIYNTDCPEPAARSEDDSATSVNPWSQWLLLVSVTLFILNSRLFPS